MKIGKIKPAATIVAQYPAGVEVTAVQHEGTLYLPVTSLGEFTPNDDDDEKPAKKVVKEDAPKVEPKKEAPKEDVKDYTEAELMDMSTKDLEKLLKNEFGIDPNKTEGKNTNKKLRLLILEAQENPGGDSDNSEEDSAEEEAPKSKTKKGSKKEPKEDPEEDSDVASLSEDIVAELEKFDEGSINKKKLMTKISSLATADDYSEDDLNDIIANFEEDSDADIDETALSIAKLISGEVSPNKDEDEEDEDEKPAKKSKGKSKKAPKEELVEPEDLKKGDRVSVYWEDQEEWFEGSVKSISKKGVIMIAYDDDTEEELDDNNTKIKLLND